MGSFMADAIGMSENFKPERRAAFFILRPDDSRRTKIVGSPCNIYYIPAAVPVGVFTSIRIMKIPV